VAQQLLSAQQAAEILGLQVRTVRQYVRQGRLPGVRIGKQYRIARADLEAFSGVHPDVGEVQGGGGPDGRRRQLGAADAPATTVEASTVVQVENLAPEASARLERTLAAAVASDGGLGEGALLRVEPLYDAARARLSVVIVGGASQTAQLLRIIDAFADL
jgi:excisionase family DNA binding protein